MVNDLGRRFTNEAASYNAFGAAAFIEGFYDNGNTRFGRLEFIECFRLTFYRLLRVLCQLV